MCANDRCTQRNSDEIDAQTISTMKAWTDVRSFMLGTLNGYTCLRYTSKAMVLLWRLWTVLGLYEKYLVIH